MQEPRTLFYKSRSDSQEHFVELVKKNLFVIHMEDFFWGSVTKWINSFSDWKKLIKRMPVRNRFIKSTLRDSNAVNKVLLLKYISSVFGTYAQTPGKIEASNVIFTLGG